MNVPHWTEAPDHFVWEAFAELSSNGRLHLGPETLQQEALLAQTSNLYVIPDQFGVVNGHLLVLPKRPITSFAALEAALDDEVTWLLQQVSDVVEATYDAHVVVAEHGECGCATNGQAHIHVLPIPATVTTDDLRTAIDAVLERRMVGIERIVYRRAEFTALEDLQVLRHAQGAEVTGELLRSSDLTMSGAYPSAARWVTELVHPYVYFRGPGVEFLSMCSLRSQFVREVVARATWLPEMSWDRRAYPDRTNMFATFETLAPVFARSRADEHGFRPRSVAVRRVGRRQRVELADAWLDIVGVRIRRRIERVPVSER